MIGTPGIWPGIENEAYHAAVGLSRSRLVRLLTETPQAFKHGAAIEETPAMRLGVALELAILEPDRFEALVRPQPKFDGRTNAGKAAKITWEQCNPGKIAVPEADYAQAVAAARLVRSKKGPAAALRQGKTQLSMWFDQGGTLCKSRPDMLDLERGICCDIKSTSRGLGDREIVRFLEDHHAAMQAAMVVAGVWALTGASIVRGMHLLVVDLSADPIDMRLVEITEDWLLHGETQFQTALRTFRECEDSGNYWGWADRGVTTVPIPAWLAKRDEREALTNMQEG